MTISEIAKKCGVAPSTVSKVLNGYPYINDETRKKVLKVVQEVNYQPNAAARTLKSNKSWMIGVIYDEEDGIGIAHPLFSKILDAFKTTMESRGFILTYLTHNLQNVYRTYVQHCAYRNIDGVIIATSINPNDDADVQEINDLLATGIPCVSVDYIADNLYSVVSDNQQGGYNATKYLIDQGHTRIAHICAATNLYTGKGRLEGYRKAMSEANLPIREDYLVTTGFSVENGYDAAREIMTVDDPPTAIFAAGDEIAYGAILYCNEHGLNVPQKVSVVGFDDIYMSKWFNGGLTTVRQQQDVIGRRAAEVLLEKLDGMAPQDQVEYIDTPLIARKTVSQRL